MSKYIAQLNTDISIYINYILNIRGVLFDHPETSKCIINPAQTNPTRVYNKVNLNYNESLTD